MESRKQAILAALDAFARQGPGLDFGNYGDMRSYRTEQRAITRDLHDYQRLAAAVVYADDIDAEALLEASRSAFSGRLVITEREWHQFTPDECSDKPCSTDCDHRQFRGYRVEYCTGQYFATEYRKAVCAVLASALWYHARVRALPAPCEHRVMPYTSGVYLGAKPGPWKELHAACAEREERGADSHYIDDRYKLLPGSKRKGSAGDWLRAYFARQFGRGIAGRYFR